MSMNYCHLHNRHYDTDKHLECPDCEAEVLSAPCGYKAMQQGMIDNHMATCEKCKEITGRAFTIPSGVIKTITKHHDSTLPSFPNNYKEGEQ